MRLQIRILTLILVMVLVAQGGVAQSLLDWNLKSTWDGFYNIDAEPWGHPSTRSEVRLNYHRAVILPFERQRAAGLKTALGLNGSTKLHIINPGFGWIMEAFNELGVTQTTGSTRSTYINTAKVLNEDVDLALKIQGVGLTTTTGDGLTLLGLLRSGGNARAVRAVDILDTDFSTQVNRQTLRTLMGNGFDVLIFDGFSNSFSDAEIAAFSAEIHRTPGVGRVIHHVYDWLNSKTLAQWKALLPNDFFVDGLTYQVQ